MFSNYFRRNSQVTPIYHRENDNHSYLSGDWRGFYSDDDGEEEEDDDTTRQPSINRLFGLLGRNKWLTRRINGITYTSLKENTNYFLDSCNIIHVKMKFEDIMMIITIFSLFVNNVQSLTEGEGIDYYFVLATSICFFIFIGELVVNSWAKTTFIQVFPTPIFTGYLFSFYWFLDVIAILSFLPDIPWIANPILFGHIRHLSQHEGSYLNLLYTARIVRLVRFIRIARSFKMSSDRKARKAREEDLFELVRIGAISYEEVEKQLELYNERLSKLGLLLSESITRRVVFILIVMTFAVPLLLFHTNNSVDNYTVGVLQDLNVNSNKLNPTAIQSVIDETIYKLDRGYRDQYVLYIAMNPYSKQYPVYDKQAIIDSLPNILIFDTKSISLNTNINQLNSTYHSGTTANTTELKYTDLSIDKEGAFYNIILTICVAIILVAGSHLLIMGAHTLIIEPIDRMLNLVEAVAKNPLRAYSFENKYNEGTGEYEIQLLQSTISKITSLLRVGFGEAGAGIISANLTTKHNSTSINPLLPGVRVYAIFGFCDILKFEDINLRLETDVLTFVNTLAEIVHSRVHSWGGQCNKNLGNAFVVVWRIGDEETILNLLYRNNLNPFATAGGLTKNNLTPKSRQSVFLPDNRTNSVVSAAIDHIPFESHISSRTLNNGNGGGNSTNGNLSNNINSINSLNNNNSNNNNNNNNNNYHRASTASTLTNNSRSIAKLASGVLRGFGAGGLNASGYSGSQEGNRSVELGGGGGGSSVAGLLDDYEYNKRKGHLIDLRRVPGVDVLADKALISYLKIIAEINRSKEILKYRYEPRLTLNGSEEFKVRMGFGLHAGWAIEGAVGSLQKVDATYLSPHVNLASRLESASRQYGVPLLFSQKFYDILSVYGQEYCRRLDVVTVKGSEIPIGIYTWDTLQDQDFFVEDRKAKRRSSMASLHTLMSNLESVVEESISNKYMDVNGSGNGSGNGNGAVTERIIDRAPSGSTSYAGPFARRFSSLVSQASSSTTPNTEAMHTSSSTISRKFSLFSMDQNRQGNNYSRESNLSRESIHRRGSNSSNMSMISTAQAALAAAQAAGITMGTFPQSLSSSNMNLTNGFNSSLGSNSMSPNVVQNLLGNGIGNSSSQNLSLIHPLNITSTMSNNNGNNSNNNPSQPISQPAFQPNFQPTFTPIFPQPSQQSKFTPLFFTAADDTMDTFSSDYDLLQLRSHIKDDFRSMFKDAVNAYIAGDWQVAKTYFERANKMMRMTAPMLKGDGPSLTLLEYMGRYDYQAPINWKGFRHLTDK